MQLAAKPSVVSLLNPDLINWRLDGRWCFIKSLHSLWSPLFISRFGASASDTMQTSAFWLEKDRQRMVFFEAALSCFSSHRCLFPDLTRVGVCKILAFDRREIMLGRDSQLLRLLGSQLLTSFAYYTHSPALPRSLQYTHIVHTNTHNTQTHTILHTQFYSASYSTSQDWNRT